MTPAEIELEGFVARYAEATSAMARLAIARMRADLPQAHVLVYDNYNALAIGFCAGPKVAGMVFSIAVYPKWVSLFFAQGARLDDPGQRLKGSGSRIRHIVLTDIGLLDDPAIRNLMEQALALAAPWSGSGEVVIQSISAKQRPRRHENFIGST